MLIYYIRHGESQDAANNLYQRLDTPLSENGKKQALITSNKLKEISFEAILTSPLKRAYETAKIISSEIRCPIEIWESLREEKRPSIIEGKSRDDPVIKELLKEFYSNYGNPGYRHSDEDTFEMLKARALRLKLELENLTFKNVLIAGHGMMLKMLASIIKYGKEVNSETFIKFTDESILENGSITEFQVSGKIWTIKGWNK